MPRCLQRRLTSTARGLPDHQNSLIAAASAGTADVILLDLDARPVVAHRGSSGHYPENTMLAFEKAIVEGAHALELDVRASADGVPVVIHDETLDRTTSGMGSVGAFDATALKRFDAGSGQEIPTLEEVLEAFPDTPMIVELKEPGVSQAVSEVVRKRADQRRLLFGSFLHAALRPFNSPEHKRSASRREVASFWLAVKLGMPGLRGAYAAFTVPETQRGLLVVDEKFVQRARRCGKPVHVWTVNDRADAQRLRTLGVSGIITNFPRLMANLED